MTPITSIGTGQFILACWAIFLVFWIITGLQAKKTVERQSGVGQNLLIRGALAIGALLILRNLFPGIFDMQLWPYSVTIGVIADILAGTGLLILLSARVILGGNWSAGVVLKENHELVQRGPYAYVRHPIYSGLLLLFLGEAVWYGDIGWFLLFIIVTVMLWFKSKQEEALMTKHFPNVYPQYKARTKALIPFLL